MNTFIPSWEKTVTTINGTPVTVEGKIGSYRFVKGRLVRSHVYSEVRPGPVEGSGYLLSTSGQACSNCLSRERFYRFNRAAGWYISHCGGCLRTLVVEGENPCPTDEPLP